MRTPLEEPIGSVQEFELLSVTLQAEGRQDIDVALPVPGETELVTRAAPFTLKEGAEVRITLGFRLGKAVEGLKFTDVRRRQGAVIGMSEVLLGGYRPGGPYEVVLPPERLPIGHLARDMYEVTGTFVDGEGNVLGHESHAFVITKDWCDT
ncbi:rho GDP-dissociation inhibitor [Streptomyces sp. A3M-1-3]|uniref:rho GDP-dissociation inhibitor n=1 Tax=Streptomyces sp. A3M-1-3 TaxID=2962044 RepID=UPI0020B836BB|nr:rho GDP-dissociation inhibitor [Streptomyces sp. A3M-1-3]MCP3820668.1 rho GDP-dissociation inhibitor [Streptomyces sp. A3M-1-3]